MRACMTNAQQNGRRRGTGTQNRHAFTSSRLTGDVAKSQQPKRRPQRRESQANLQQQPLHRHLQQQPLHHWKQLPLHHRQRQSPQLRQGVPHRLLQRWFQQAPA